MYRQTYRPTDKLTEWLTYSSIFPIWIEILQFSNHPSQSSIYTDYLIFSNHKYMLTNCSNTPIPLYCKYIYTKFHHYIPFTLINTHILHQQFYIHSYLINPYIYYPIYFINRNILFIPHQFIICWLEEISIYCFFADDLTQYCHFISMTGLHFPSPIQTLDLFNFVWVYYVHLLDSIMIPVYHSINFLVFKVSPFS